MTLADILRLVLIFELLLSLLFAAMITAVYARRISVSNLAGDGNRLRRKRVKHILGIGVGFIIVNATFLMASYARLGEELNYRQYAFVFGYAIICYALYDMLGYQSASYRFGNDLKHDTQ